MTKKISKQPERASGGKPETSSADQPPGSQPARRRLGQSEMEIDPLVFGCNVFGWTVDEPTAFSLLDQLLAAGFRTLDTADIYPRWVPGNQGGESETMIGNWLRRSGKRDQVILATKVGMEMGQGKKGLSRAYILKAVEDSLRRLRTDFVDLYQAHIDDEQTPLEETLEAFAQLVQQGKVRAIGASNYKSPRLQQALEISRNHGWPAYVSLQPLYNLYDRAEYETELEPVCREHGLGVITYFSLASGFLSGKYRSQEDLAGHQRGSRVEKYLNQRGMRILAALDEVADEQGATPAQVALAWLLTRPTVSAPIASATSPAQLDDLLEATRLVLTPASIARLDSASQ